MPEILDEKPAEETKQSAITTYTKAGAIAAGLLLLGVDATVRLTDQAYPETAKIQVVQDSVKADNSVSRKVATHDTSFAADSLVGHSLRFLVLLDDKTVLYEQKQEITEPPRPPHDGFSATFRGYVYEDVLPKDSTEIKPEIK